MPQPRPISAMVVEEALASGDARFVELLRQCEDPKGLARIVEKWKKDHRPWARQQILGYLREPMDVPGHEVVVKRLFKQAQANDDAELMGTFMAAFDRLARRRRVRNAYWDWQTRETTEWWELRSFFYNRLTQKPKWFDYESWLAHIQKRKLRLFSYHTRYFLRRWAWRYFRRMGYSSPDRYPGAIAGALARYRDEDLADGQAILDSWGLMHACFGESADVKFSVRHADLTQPRQLEEMVAPYFEALWKKPESSAILLDLALGANARIVRMWAATLIRRHHLGSLGRLPIDRLLALLDHADPAVQALGAELIERAQGLEKLDLATWLRLLRTRNVTALASIASAMQKHVRPERVNLEQSVSLACARPVPVAKLGLEILRSKTIATENDREQIARLASAQCEGLGGEIAGVALTILGAKETYNIDRVSRFFDSLLATIREGAWGWLKVGTAGWDDPALWSRLLETPYEDVRLKLIAAMEERQAAARSQQTAVADLSRLWCSVLLGIHRGGRTKLVALGQVSDALARSPEHAAILLPVLAVAVRSVRLPEARRGLAAIVQLLEKRPELSPLVRQHFPEMQIEEVAPS